MLLLILYKYHCQEVNILRQMLNQALATTSIQSKHKMDVSFI